MFKALFGVLGLLIAMAVVSSLAKTQLGAIGQIGQMTTRVLGSSGGDGAAAAGRTAGEVRLGGVAAIPGSATPTVPQQAQGMQQSVLEGTREALDQGEQRYKRAEAAIGR
jgi:hypothetical protein